jgi:hypothetical protein
MGISALPDGTDGLLNFVMMRPISDFIPQELMDKIRNPVLFRDMRNKKILGYEATVFIDICYHILIAHKPSAPLDDVQLEVATRCSDLMCHFAKYGSQIE